MVFQCSCGFYQARRYEISDCPRCHKPFLAVCYVCDLYTTHEPYGECRCGKITEDLFASSETGFAWLFDTGEAPEPDARQTPPRPIAALLSDDVTPRTVAWGTYGSFRIPSSLERLEARRLKSHADLEQALATMRALRDNIWRSQKAQVYEEEFLRPLADCFDQVARAGARFFELFASHGEQYFRFFEECALQLLADAISNWLAMESGKLIEARKIGESSVQEVHALLKDDTATRTLARRLGAALIAPLQCPAPLDRKIEALPDVPLDSEALEAAGSIEEIKLRVIDRQLSWAAPLDTISTLPGLRYLNGLCQLAGSLRQDKWRRCFMTVIDCATYGLTAPGIATTKEVTDLGVSSLVAEKLRKQLADLGKDLMRDYWCTLKVIETIVEEFGDIRLRFLAKPERGQYIVQRTIQSGDTNGVAFSLVAFDAWSLVYLTPPDGRNAAESALRFYAALGVSPDRIRISIVADTQEKCDFSTLADALSKYTSRPIDKIRYRGGVNTFYQNLANLNYITDPSELLYVDAIYHLRRNVYKPVGHSTDIIYRYVKERQGDAYIAQRIRKALTKHVSDEDQKAIEEFVDTFARVQATERCLRAPLHDIITVASTKYGMIDLAPGRGIRKRPDLFHPLVLLYWVRGPQGDEAKEMEYRGHGMFGMVPKGGKPWHHATMQLLVTVRCMCQELAEALGCPVYFVPIGDVPEDAYSKIRFYPYTKTAQASPESNSVTVEARGAGDDDGGVSLRMECFRPQYPDRGDMVKFFERLPAFRSRNRFNQLYLFHELFRRKELRIIQLGLRSGAIEQGMYLGIPTVYIDIDTESIQSIRPGEPDTTERMWKMTARDTCFPFFHALFSKNVIGVYNRIVGEEQVIDIARFVRLAIKYKSADDGIWKKLIPAHEKKEDGDPSSDESEVLPVLSESELGEHVAAMKKRPMRVIRERTHFWDGTLRPDEVRGLFMLLKDLYLTYERHWKRVMEEGEEEDMNSSGTKAAKGSQPEDGKKESDGSNPNPSSDKPSDDDDSPPKGPPGPAWRAALEHSGLRAGDSVQFLYLIHRDDPTKNTYCTARVLGPNDAPVEEGRPKWPGRPPLTTQPTEPALFERRPNRGEMEFCVYVKCTSQTDFDPEAPNVVGSLFAPQIGSLTKL